MAPNATLLPERDLSRRRTLIPVAPGDPEAALASLRSGPCRCRDAGPSLPAQDVDHRGSARRPARAAASAFRRPALPRGESFPARLAHPALRLCRRSSVNWTARAGPAAGRHHPPRPVDVSLDVRTQPTFGAFRARRRHLAGRIDRAPPGIRAPWSPACSPSHARELTESRAWREARAGSADRLRHPRARARLRGPAGARLARDPSHRSPTCSPAACPLPTAR